MTLAAIGTVRSSVAEPHFFRDGKNQGLAQEPHTHPRHDELQAEIVIDPHWDELLDGIETLCIGAVLVEAVRKPRGRQALFPDVDPVEHPHLTKALATNELTAKELFAERIRSFLYGAMRD